MIVLEFIIGAIVMVVFAEIGRRVVYWALWGSTPGAADESFGDVVIGWIVGGLFAFLVLILVAFAVGLGGAILAMTCGSDEVTFVPQPATSQVQP